MISSVAYELSATEHWLLHSQKGINFSRYESEFFQNVVNGRDIVAWGAVDHNRPYGQHDEIIGFVTARLVPANESEVSLLCAGQYDLHPTLLINCVGFQALHMGKLCFNIPQIVLKMRGPQMSSFYHFLNFSLLKLTYDSHLLCLNCLDKIG